MSSFHEQLIWIRFCLAVGSFCVGGSFLKRYADFGQPHDLGLSLGAYLIGNLLFIEILKRGLGFGMVLSSAGQLCLMVIIGALVFGERVGPMQGVGVTLAVLAIAAFSYGAEVQ